MTKSAVIIIIAALIFVACKNGDKLSWTKTSDGLIEYAIEKNGKEQGNGKIVVKAYGIMNAGTIVRDNSLSIPAWDSLSQIASLTEALEKLNFSIGTQGYCRFDFSRWLDSIKRQIFQITVFLRPTFNEKDSSREIAKLDSFNVFDSVIFLSSEKAKKEWAQSGGEDFKEFIDNSLLPISIELRLKDRFVNKQSIDSIVQILNKDLNYEQVKIPPNYSEVFSSTVFKKPVVFKFIVF